MLRELNFSHQAGMSTLHRFQDALEPIQMTGPERRDVAMILHDETTLSRAEVQQQPASQCQWAVLSGEISAAGMPLMHLAITCRIKSILQFVAKTATDKLYCTTQSTASIFFIDVIE